MIKHKKIIVFVSVFLLMSFVGAVGVILGMKYFQPTSFIKVTSPNGGEIMSAGRTYDVTWKSKGVSRVKIVECALAPLLPKKEVCLELMAIPYDGLDASTGIYRWRLDENDPLYPGNVKIKIWDVGDPTVFDESDSYIAITKRSSPASCVRDSGRSGVSCDNIFSEDYCGYNPDGTSEAYVRKCNAKTGNDCSALVNVDTVPCSFGCKNGACIAMPSPHITLLYPNNYEQFDIGQDLSIIWDSYGISNVKIELCALSEFLNQVCSPLSETEGVKVSASSKSYVWRITADHPYIPSDHLRIRITSLDIASKGFFGQSIQEFSVVGK